MEIWQILHYLTAEKYISLVMKQMHTGCLPVMMQRRTLHHTVLLQLETSKSSLRTAHTAVWAGLPGSQVVGGENWVPSGPLTSMCVPCYIWAPTCSLVRVCLMLTPSCAACTRPGTPACWSANRLETQVWGRSPGHCSASQLLLRTALRWKRKPDRLNRQAYSYFITN